MTKTFEDKRRLSLAQFARDAGQAGNETTPSSISTAVIEFARELGGEPPQLIPVAGDSYGLYGWCLDGVLEKVKNDGGQIVFGWTIWEWPDVMFTAEFHAVWSDGGNGTLIDITPKPQGETAIVFVPDSSYPLNFNFDKRPTNRRKRIAEEPDYTKAAAAHIARMKVSQVEYASGRAAKKGRSLAEWVADRQPRDKLPDLVERLIEVCNQIEMHMDELNPGGGTFEPDRKFLKLTREKGALINNVDAEMRRRRTIRRPLVERTNKAPVLSEQAPRPHIHTTPPSVGHSRYSHRK